MKKKIKRYLLKYIFFLKISFYKNYLRHSFNTFIEIIFYYNFNFTKFFKNYKANSSQLKYLEFICSRSFLNIFSTSTYQHENLRFSQKTITFKNKKIEIIYLTSEAIRVHLDRINQLTNRFIIIMGNSDLTIDYNIQDITKLLNNRLLVKIYSQNIKIKHKKVVQLPIGVPLHSDFYFDFISRKKILPFSSQKKLIKAIKFKIKKKYLIYCNYHFAMNSERANCKKKLLKSLCYYTPKRISLKNTWNEIKNYQFIVCPEGNGVDTHRVWEGLLLGAIPIVKINFLSPLYGKLPIIIIKDWSQVNLNFLDQQLKKIKSRKYDFSILFMNYWINEIYQKKNISKKIKYDLFLSSLSKNDIKRLKHYI